MGINIHPKSWSRTAKCVLGLVVFSIICVPVGHFYLHFFSDYLVVEKNLSWFSHRTHYSLLLTQTRSGRQCAVLAVFLPDADGTVPGYGIVPQCQERIVNYCGYTATYRYTQTAKIRKLDTSLRYGKVYFVQRKPFIERVYGRTTVTNKLQIIAERSFDELGIPVEMLFHQAAEYKLESWLETNNSIKSIKSGTCSDSETSR